MSFDDTQMQEQPADTPPSAFSTGTSGLDPTQKLRPRQVVGAEMEGFNPLPEDITGTTSVGTAETSSARAREIAGPTSFGLLVKALLTPEASSPADNMTHPKRHTPN